MAKINYEELEGSILAVIKIEETDGSVREIYLPKFIIDLVKAGIQDGSIDISTLLARSNKFEKQLG